MSFHLFFNGKDSIYSRASINCIQPLRDELWIGTNGYGILVCDTAGHVKRRIGKAQGLADNVVYSLPQSGGVVLAGTGNGLSVINPQTGLIANYTSRQYLPNNEFNRSAWLVCGDTVYMGTVNGLIRVRVTELTQYRKPDAAIRPTALSYVTDTGMLVDYTIGYRSNREISIPAGTHDFSISVSGLSAESGELYYSLKSGTPPEPLGRQRTLSFVGVSPGSYELRFFRHASDGLQLQELLQVPVTVQPRYYQAWWFRVLLIVIIVGMVIAIVRYRERALRKEHELRRRIAGDLHDEIGSALTRIYLQTDSLIHSSNAPEAETMPVLSKISASSQEALSSMNDIVWSVDADYDNAADLVSRMKDYLVKVREQLSFECSFHVSGNYEHLKMGQAVRQNIFLIFREGVNNAVKHSADGRLDVAMAFEQGFFRMKLQNALPEAGAKIISGGHGLRSMEHRAGKIGSELKTDKSAGQFILLLNVRLH